jgi:hypothetical protein
MGSLTKGIIGKEDLSIQTNTAAAETFSRLASAGSTISLTKIPDIWDGTGKIRVAEARTQHFASHYSSLLTAVSSVNSLTDKILYIDNGDWAVGTTDLSSYTAIQLCFLPGSTISPTVGTTLTLYSPSNIIAQPNQQIFGGAGTVSFGKAFGDIYPQWWGAKGDGSTDDTTAIQAAFTAAQSGVLNYKANAIQYVGAQPTVRFLAGHYVISDTIHPQSYVNMIGTPRTIIRGTDSTKDLVDFEYGLTSIIDGFTFIGGKTQLKYTNTDMSANMIVNNCEFTWNNSTYAIDFYVTAPATQLNHWVTFSNCKFQYLYLLMDIPPATVVTIRDCEYVGLTALTDTAGQFRNYGALYLYNFDGSPTAGTVPIGSRWVDNYGRFHADHSRFGSEGGGMPTVYNYIGPDGVYPLGVGSAGNGEVSIENCALMVGNLENTIIKFMTDIPQVIKIKGNSWSVVTNIFTADAGFNIATYLNALDPYANIWVDVSMNEGMPGPYWVNYPVGFDTTNINNVHIYGDVPLRVVTFVDGDTTPAVGDRKLFVTANTAPTTITGFDQYYLLHLGDEILVRFGDAVTTIDFGTRIAASLQGNGAANWTPAEGDFMRCVTDGTYWYCTIVDAT